MKLDLVKKYIEILSGKEESRVMSALRGLPDLDRDEKNLIYTYLFPKPLLHMELPSVIMSDRGKHTEGHLSENFEETLILLRAYRTLQYRKFMLHLLHSFIEGDNEKVYVEEAVPGREGYTCGICKKQLYDYRYWKSLCEKNPKFGEQERKEYLAFASTQSSQHICIDCMVQLQFLHKILLALEGPTYLSWIVPKQEKRVPCGGSSL